MGFLYEKTVLKARCLDPLFTYILGDTMKNITVQAIKKHNSPVDLRIRTMEGNIYVAVADIAEKDLFDHQVVDKKGVPLKARSVGEMREYFNQVTISSARLVFDEAHNEMMTSNAQDVPHIEHRGHDDFASQNLNW